MDVMVEHRVFDRFWVPSDALDVARQELQDAKTWLAGCMGPPILTMLW